MFCGKIPREYCTNKIFLSAIIHFKKFLTRPDLELTKRLSGKVRVPSRSLDEAAREWRWGILEWRRQATGSSGEQARAVRQSPDARLTQWTPANRRCTRARQTTPKVSLPLRTSSEWASREPNGHEREHESVDTRDHRSSPA